MLFYVAWKPCVGLTADQQKRSLDLFTRWTPPKGLEFKGFYGLADGRGFCICEVDSVETMYRAVSPWAGVYNDYEMVPAMEIDKFPDILKGAIAFREA
jgi:hypothetical protein